MRQLIFRCRGCHPTLPPDSLTSDSLANPVLASARSASHRTGQISRAEVNDQVERQSALAGDHQRPFSTWFPRCGPALAAAMMNRIRPACFRRSTMCRALRGADSRRSPRASSIRTRENRCHPAHHVARGTPVMDTTTCPQCETTATVLERCVLESSDGPIEHARTVCLAAKRERRAVDEQRRPLHAYRHDELAGNACRHPPRPARLRHRTAFVHHQTPVSLVTLA